MTLEVAKKIEKNMSQSFNFKPRIHFFGGEPLVNREFPAILQHFSAAGYKSSITTNGYLLKEYRDVLLRSKGIKDIHVSFNDLDFDRMLGNLGDLDAGNPKNRARVTINVPITELNQHRLVEIVEAFESSNIEYITFQHRGFIWYKTYIEMDYMAIKKQMKKISKRDNRVPVLFHPRIKLEDIESYYSDYDYPYRFSKCYYPWFVLFIKPDGSLMPCDEVNINVGNALKESLKDLWNNKDYVAFRRSILSKGVTKSICHRCDHREY